MMAPIDFLIVAFTPQIIAIALFEVAFALHHRRFVAGRIINQLDVYF